MNMRKSTWILLALLILAGSVSAQAPNGDYGDAPDGTQAYPGVTGLFPTLYASTSGETGGHTLTVGQEMIGDDVSAENDADDALDPDGIQNLVDTDKDDPVYIQIVAVAIPAPARLSFEVKIADNAPSATRYINALIDFDRNGTWGGDRYGKEWVVKNQKVNIPPGNKQWVNTDWFNWGGGMTMPTDVWGRLAITREPINVRDWTGEGEFEYGEIQDFIVELRDNPPPPPKNKTRNVTNKTKGKKCGNNKKEAPEECDGTDDKACQGKCLPNCKCPKPGKKGGEGPVEPGPSEGPCTTPVGYHALVINAGDNKRRKQGMSAADDIFGLLGEQGYDTGQYLAPYWDKEVGDTPDNGVTAGGYSDLKGIEEAIKNLGKKVKCVDRVMIYIVGHGLRPGGKKYGKTWSSGGIILQGKKGGKEVLTPEQLDAWIKQYIPACENQDCKTPETSCHVSVVVESCHSGNFLGPLSKKGRTVAVSCSANEVAYFGEDADGNSHGGDYTNGYVKDMESPSTADTNKDGYVSVAEAHKSATDKLSVAKKYGSAQTPGFFSDECECLPLTCEPKCPNGKVDGDEECDPEADPTGCSDGMTCNDECVCEYTGTPEEPPVCEDGYLYQTECEMACSDGSCIMGDDQCYYCIVPEGCPDSQYPYAECLERANSYQQCVCPDESVDCCYLQTLCNRGEYLSDTCDGECSEGENCIIADADVPCYTCGTQECGSNEYETQADCEADCSGDCNVNEATSCWYCEEESTCEDIGLYSSQASCQSDCDEPDVCLFLSEIGCWNCAETKTVCGAGLYNSSDCDGECPTQCQIYGDGPCYRCVCADLIVSSRSTSVKLSGSVSCQGEVCNMVCTRSGYIKLRVGNSGNGAAGASSARVSISPPSENWDVPIEALNSGQTSSEKTIDLAKTYNGPGSDCTSLDWWAEVYTVDFTADYGAVINECDETNNKQQSIVQED